MTRLDPEVWNGFLELKQELSKGEGIDKKEFWHYTSLKSLMSIFDIKGANPNISQCNMYASNIRYLNDEEEYKEGKRFLSSIKNCNDCESEYTDDIYVISFCGNGDLLSQWKYYAKGSGISIQFNLKDIKYQYFSTFEDGEVYPDDKTCPISVKYTESQKKSFLENLQKTSVMQFNSNEDGLENVIIPFCKNESFYEEEESRLVFYTCNRDLEKVKFNTIYNDADSNNIKPSLKVKFNSSNESLIKKIIVGPGTNQNLVFNTLIHIFDNTNYMFHENNEGEISQAHSKPIDSETYQKNAREFLHKVESVNWGTEEAPIARKSYKCENGIIIMKSAIPFRGWINYINKL